MEWFTWILTNYSTLLNGLIGLFSAAIVIALVIPGAQPEKFLQSVVDFLSKFSKK